MTDLRFASTDDLCAELTRRCPDAVIGLTKPIDGDPGNRTLAWFMGGDIVGSVATARAMTIIVEDRFAASIRGKPRRITG